MAVKILMSGGEGGERQRDPGLALTLSAPTLRGLEEEAGLLAGLRHPNIVQARG